MAPAIFVRDRRIAVDPDLRVRSWHNTGLRFDCRVRRARTRVVVLHWTSAENPPAAMHKNMREHRNERGVLEPLSVHFAVDQVGEVYQFCDADALCAHARGVNDVSVGIEILNRGSNMAAPHKGIERELLTEKIHGVDVPYYAFTPAQVQSVLSLTSVLCRVYGLPMRVPMRGDDVFPTELPPSERAVFTGVIGHLHAAAGGRKSDPGLALLRAVAARGAAQDALR
jgi:N-acetyl-anhydromuramyl-L-alanine amidase AmpD